MNLEFMRKVDYWIGIPLTTILSLWCRLSDLVAHKAPADKRRVRHKVLFIELSEMGSAILADPALRQVAHHGHELFFVIFERNAASLRILKTVPESNTFTIRDRSFVGLVMDTVRFLKWCRKNKISAVIDLESFSRFTACLAALSGARQRIGFANPRAEGLYRGFILTDPITYNPHIHIAKNFLALVEPLCESTRLSQRALVKRPIADNEIRLARAAIAPTSIDRVYKNLRARNAELRDDHRLVLINVNAGDFLPQRKWPKSSFTALTQMLLATHPDVVVCLTGSPKERSDVDEVAQAVASPRCMNIAGDLAFDDLPSLYSIAEVLLTNDSGPAHFASAVGTRTFVLFGPETPTLYGPLQNATSIYAGLACSPCISATNHRNTTCNDNQCLKLIPPGFVFQLIHQYLCDEQSVQQTVVRVPGVL